MVVCDDVFNYHKIYRREGCSAKNQEEIIIFAPSHVYFHLNKNFPPHKTFLNSKEKFTYE